MDKRVAVRLAKITLRSHRFQHFVHDGQLRAAGGKVGGELSKLRIQVGPQFGQRQLQPIVCGNLRGLTYLHGFEVGQNHIGEKWGEGISGIIHNEILSANPNNRLITNGCATVTHFDLDPALCNGPLTRVSGHVC